MTDIYVRTGSPSDIHKVMELALLVVAENGRGRPDPKKLLNDIYPSLHLDGGIVGVIGDGDKLEAAILLRIEPFWYVVDEDKVLLERAIYVHPDFRASKIGRARLLCEFAKKAADELKLELVIGVLTKERAEAKVRLYERQFGPQCGAYWIYTPPSVATTGQSQGI